MPVTIEEVSAQCKKILEDLQTTGQMSTDIELLKLDMKSRVTGEQLEKALGVIRTKIAVIVVTSNIVLASITSIVVRAWG